MNIYQLVLNDSDRLYTWCADRIKAAYPHCRYTRVTDFKYNLKFKDRRRAVHRFQVDTLMNDPDAIIIDGDMLPLNKVFEPLKNGKMYINNDGSCCASILAGNGQKETISWLYFSWTLEEEKPYPRCLHQIIETSLHNFNFILPGYFQHLQLGQLLAKNGGENKECAIEHSNDGYRFNWIQNRDSHYYKEVGI